MRIRVLASLLTLGLFLTHAQAQERLCVLAAPEPLTREEAAICQPVAAACQPAVAPCCRSCPYPPGCVWASAEYLLWWTKGDRLPPLLTTSPVGTPLANAGVLGRPGTSVLFGDERVNDDARS